jgi:tRNA(Ile)-lysidine synthase TilS/MesJ
VYKRQLYFKEILNGLEAEHPGTKYNYYMAFLHARKNGLFAATAAEEPIEMHRCPVCGQPTTATERCAFCRLVEKTA